MKIIVINGPNLNKLGMREQKHYDTFSLLELEGFLLEKKSEQTELAFFQNNSESKIIDFIHSLMDIEVRGIIINAAAFTHTSVAIRDALLCISVPFIEVHISNVFARESFRHHSVLSDVAIGTVCGLGKFSYLSALSYFEGKD